MAKSGLLYDFGMGFWGANGHDGIWHIALINSLSRGTFSMPIFAGAQIQNYHLGYDLILAAITRLTNIPASTLYFQMIPPVLAVAIGVCLYIFVNHWTQSSKASLWSLFFLYFGGSWGWLVNLFRQGNLSGESMFWSQQSISTLINPPFALSLAILFLGLYFLSRKAYIKAALLFSLLALIKVYASVLILLGLLVSSLFYKPYRKVLLITGFLTLILFLPFNRNSTKLLVWQPGWFLDNMMGLSDRVNWPTYYSALTNYKLGHNYPKLILAYFVAAGVFILGNLGTRVVAVLVKFSQTPIDLVLLPMITAGVVAPLLMVQTGTPWNTIQFTYYSLILTGIYSALALTHARLSNIIISIVICALTLPTTYESLHHYLPTTPPAAISTLELEALNFLSRQPAGVVLAPPVYPDPYAPAPRPLYLYESTAYVSALSSQQLYLEDYVNLNITGYPWPDRLAQLNQFFSTNNLDQAKHFLSSNNISYIYLPNIKSFRPNFSASQLGGTSIFENSSSAVWKIN
jgi:hypothetical protein